MTSQGSAHTHDSNASSPQAARPRGRRPSGRYRRSAWRTGSRVCRAARRARRPAVRPVLRRGGGAGSSRNAVTSTSRRRNYSSLVWPLCPHPRRCRARRERGDDAAAGAAPLDGTLEELHVAPPVGGVLTLVQRRLPGRSPVHGVAGRPRSSSGRRSRGAEGRRLLAASATIGVSHRPGPFLAVRQRGARGTAADLGAPRTFCERTARSI
jgi:hypothetical protein